MIILGSGSLSKALSRILQIPFFSVRKSFNNNFSDLFSLLDFILEADTQPLIILAFSPQFKRAGSDYSTLSLDDYNLHVDILRKFISDLLKLYHSPRIVYLSSAGALYQSSVGLVDESSLPNPVSKYGNLKLADEVFLRGYTDYFADFFLLRISTCYGFWSSQSYAGVVSQWYRNYLSGTPSDVFVDDSRCIDFVHISDVADLLSLIACGSIPSGIINICSGSSLSISDAASLFQHKFPGFLRNDITGIVSPLSSMSYNVAKLEYYLHRKPIFFNQISSSSMFNVDSIFPYNA